MFYMGVIIYLKAFEGHLSAERQTQANWLLPLCFQPSEATIPTLLLTLLLLLPLFHSS